ncbi:MAG: putative alpha/beta hydrolase [Bacteriovoracaceae bacterium]|nr:putative alpha/beta hydrolase [Bacteriovoracaceae bacterium]
MISISNFQDILFSFVSLTNSQELASKFLPPSIFLPKVFVPRLRHGAGISMDEAAELLKNIPSLASKPWTAYWKTIGLEFESKENYRAAAMSYIMGCFPKEDVAWKDEINELKRKSFQKWCKQVGAPFEEKIVETKLGKIRYYLCKPHNMNGRSPVTIFLNGLEGSAEEFAFPLHKYLNEGTGFAALSIPGSADYESPMTPESDQSLKYVIDDIVKQPWVDSEKLGMVGFSFGAYWTLICAKTDSRIKFSICNGTPLNRTFNPQRSFGLNPVISHALLCMFRLKHPFQLISRIHKLADRAKKLQHIKSGPLLAMNGDCDTIVDPRDTHELGQVSPHKLIWLKNDDHCGLFHYDRMVSIIVAWTKRSLKGISDKPD